MIKAQENLTKRKQIDASLSVKQTLAQQIQITDQDIKLRKDLLGFLPAHEEVLTKAKDLAEEVIDQIVETFYEKQLKHSEIALLIGDLHTLARLKNSLRSYSLDLFGGQYDMAYVEKRLRIGKVHQRIGVEPKLYISSIFQLETSIETSILPLLKDRISNRDFITFQDALKRLFMFDMQLVFDTYIATLITEVETARKDLKVYADGLEGIIAERTKQLEELSTTDALTGLYNQRVFYEQLKREIAVAERIDNKLTLMYFDVNGLKKLNDEKGHFDGDLALEFIGECVKTSIREVDYGCRYGGDEFCIILPNTEQLMAKHIVAKRLIKAIESYKGFNLSISMGIIQTGPEVFCKTDELVNAAAQLMYLAKGKAKKTPGSYIEITEFHLGKGDAKKAYDALVARRKEEENKYKDINQVAI